MSTIARLNSIQIDHVARYEFVIEMQSSRGHERAAMAAHPDVQLASSSFHVDIKDDTFFDDWMIVEPVKQKRKQKIKK